MLGKIRSFIGGPASQPQARADYWPSISIEELMGSFPPMKPVLPPPAINDDPMAPVYEAVEQELYQAGMLKRRQA